MASTSPSRSDRKRLPVTIDLARTQRNTPVGRLIVGVTVLLATSVIAITGYVIAGWEVVDAIYMVTITIFGVGYGEVHPLHDPRLKLFTVGVIVAGCSSGIYVIGGILQMVTEGEINRVLGVHNRQREIDKQRDHVIICGYGRVGTMLAQQLKSGGTSVVIVDSQQERIDRAIEDGFLAYCGDGSDDEVLTNVGIERASALATVLPKDATNVFITLTARDLNQAIHVIARAECPSTERKLLRSGADRVVMPAAIGAIRIAQLVEETQLADSDCDMEYRGCETVEDRLRRDIHAISNASVAPQLQPLCDQSIAGPAGASFDTSPEPVDTIAAV